MKRITFDNWLIKEAAYFSNLNTRSVKAIASKNIARSNEYLKFYFFYTNRFINGGSKNITKIILEYASEKNNKEFIKNYIKTFNTWQNSTFDSERKKELLNKLKNKNLYKLAKDLNYNYSNVYRFFIRKELNALTLEKAQNIVLASK